MRPQQIGRTLKACWPCHVVKALIEMKPGTKALTEMRQILKACWSRHVGKALIEKNNKSNSEGPSVMSRCRVSVGMVYG